MLYYSGAAQVLHQLLSEPNMHLESLYYFLVICNSKIFKISVLIKISRIARCTSSTRPRRVLLIHTHRHSPHRSFQALLTHVLFVYRNYNCTLKLYVSYQSRRRQPPSPTSCLSCESQATGTHAPRRPCCHRRSIDFSAAVVRRGRVVGRPTLPALGYGQGRLAYNNAEARPSPIHESFMSNFHPGHSTFDFHN